MILYLKNWHCPLQTFVPPEMMRISLLKYNWKIIVFNCSLYQWLVLQCREKWKQCYQNYLQRILFITKIILILSIAAITWQWRREGGGQVENFNNSNKYNFWCSPPFTEGRVWVTLVPFKPLAKLAWMINPSFLTEDFSEKLQTLGLMVQLGIWHATLRIERIFMNSRQSTINNFHFKYKFKN